MKKIRTFVLNFLSLVLIFSIAFTALVMGISSVSYADDLKVSELARSPLELKQEIVISSLDQKIGRSGCCSWHGGVCDCIGGRVVCCDGTFSPSCTCHHDSNRDVLNFKK